jgi:hypothetical protein
VFRFQRNMWPGPEYSSTQDSYVDRNEPDTPNGNASILNVNSDGRQKAFVQFDLSQHIPANAVVTEARLELFLQFRDTSTEARVDVYELLRPWSELEVTWNRPSATETWGTDGCEGAADRGFQSLGGATLRFANRAYAWTDPGLTQLVQRWVADSASNHGVVLIGSPAYLRQIWSLVSSDNQGSSEQVRKRPLLEVTFYLPRPEPTATISLTPEPTASATQTSSPTTVLAGTVTPTPSPTPTPTATGRVPKRVFLPLVLRQTLAPAKEAGVKGSASLSGSYRQRSRGPW